MELPDSFTGSEYKFNLNTNFDIRRHRIEESREDAAYRILAQLNSACYACSMCEFGNTFNTIGSISYDPHIFSNLQKSSIIHLQDTPKGIASKDYIDNPYNVYVTYLTKCNGGDNKDACRPWLDLEMGIIKPKIIIIDDESVFQYILRTREISDSHPIYKFSNYKIYYANGDEDKRKLKILLRKMAS